MGHEPPSTARSMMVGQFSLVLTGACKFGHGAGGFATNFIHPNSPSGRLVASCDEPCGSALPPPQLHKARRGRDRPPGQQRHALARGRDHAYLSCLSVEIAGWKCAGVRTEMGFGAWGFATRAGVPPCHHRLRRPGLPRLKVSFCDESSRSFWSFGSSGVLLLPAIRGRTRPPAELRKRRARAPRSGLSGSREVMTSS